MLPGLSHAHLDLCGAPPICLLSSCSFTQVWKKTGFLMLEDYQTHYLDAAHAGDQDAFGQLTEPYRRELFVHCYRMLGSVEDAEDTLQETLLRAWRRLSTLEERASLRAWLYKIATNAALDLIDRRKARIMPSSLAPMTPGDQLPGPSPETGWVEPLPDTLIDDRHAADPEARYEISENITLAFLVALQALPGRQRAVLILRDVLGWNTEETAQILGMTTAAVNSALQRARAAIRQRQVDDLPVSSIEDDLTRSLLSRYVRAWESADTATLISLLREDAALTMPPLPAWYRGREAIRWFLDSYLFAPPNYRPIRLLPVRANGCPAFVVYQPDEVGVFRPVALQVLTITENQIAAIDDFLSFDGSLFRRFDVPSSL
jgi:RNA polymerase sigma-70 factor (ECF subfamily)